MNKAKIAISTQLCILEIFVTLVIVVSINTPAYAHNFSPNSLSTFISLVREADVELSLANSNFPLNITLALDHSKDAIKLMNSAYRLDDETIDDADFVRKYNNALNSQNETIHALVVANIVDRILIEYGEALDIQYDLTNMSNMDKAMRDDTANSLISSSPSYYADEPTQTIIQRTENNSDDISIVNFDDYQSAQKLSELVSQIFNDRLRPLAWSSNDTANKAAEDIINNSLTELRYMLNNKASAQDVMMLVHGRLHPSLQLAYNLKLK
jgi:hypothetical protein